MLLFAMWQGPTPTVWARAEQPGAYTQALDRQGYSCQWWSNPIRSVLRRGGQRFLWATGVGGEGRACVGFPIPPAAGEHQDLSVVASSRSSSSGAFLRTPGPTRKSPAQERFVAVNRYRFRLKK